MSAKIIVPVCWTGDENGEYDVETMIDDFTDQLQDITGHDIKLSLSLKKMERG